MSTRTFEQLRWAGGPGAMGLRGRWWAAESLRLPARNEMDRTKDGLLLSVHGYGRRRTSQRQAMTSAEADALIATMPKPGGLQLYREGDWIVMAGGKTGTHALLVGPSSAERLLVHWQGFVKNQSVSMDPARGPSAALPRRLPARSDSQPSAEPPALAHVSPFARKVYLALCKAKKRSLMYGSLATTLGVGRWKTPHSYLSSALYELTSTDLVSSDNHGRYTAVCGGERKP